LEVLMQRAFTEMRVVLEVHEAHTKRVAASLPASDKALYLSTRGDELKTLQEQFGKYTNWQYFRSRLLDNDYIDQMENAFQQMQTAYLSATGNVYDLYRGGRKSDRESLLDPGLLIDFGAFFSTNLFLKGAGFGLLKKIPVFLPPILAGRVISNTEYALSHEGDKRRIPLFIPKTYAVPAQVRPFEGVKEDEK